MLTIFLLLLSFGTGLYIGAKHTPKVTTLPGQEGVWFQYKDTTKCINSKRLF